MGGSLRTCLRRQVEGKRQILNPTQQSTYSPDDIRRLVFRQLLDQEYTNPLNLESHNSSTMTTTASDTPLYDLTHKNSLPDPNDFNDDAYVRQLALSLACCNIDYTWPQDRKYLLTILHRSKITSLNTILREGDSSAPFMRELDIAAAPVKCRAALLVTHFSINVKID